MRIIISDQDIIFRRGIVSLLSEDQHLVLEADSEDELRHILQKNALASFLVFVDTGFTSSLCELVNELRRISPGVKVACLSEAVNHSLSQQLLHNGANAILAKQNGYSEISACIYFLQHQDLFMNHETTQVLFGNSLAKNLPARTKKGIDFCMNNREKEIIQLMYEELSAKEIADRLYISKRTVEWHRKQLMEKIGAKNMIGLIKFGIRSNYINTSIHANGHQE